MQMCVCLVSQVVMCFVASFCVTFCVQDGQHRMHKYTTRTRARTYTHTNMLWMLVNEMLLNKGAFWFGIAEQHVTDFAPQKHPFPGNIKGSWYKYH